MDELVYESPEVLVYKMVSMKEKGFSNKEIAKEIDLPVPAVRGIVHILTIFHVIQK